MIFPQKKDSLSANFPKGLCRSGRLILVSPVLLWIAVSRATLQESMYFLFHCCFSYLPGCQLTKLLSRYEFNSQRMT